MKKLIPIILSIILATAIILPASAFSTIAVKGIKLDKSSINLKVGQYYQLKITLSPKNTTQRKLTFVTGNKKIATIDTTGKIKGISKGTTTITIYTFNKKIYAACKVDVSNDSSTTAISKDQPGWKADTSPVTFEWLIGDSSFNQKWGEDPVSKMVMKKTGVKINFIVPTGNLQDKMNTLIASGDLPDLFSISGSCATQINQMVEGKLLYSLNELADKYDPYFYKVANTQRLKWYAYDDGKTYFYPAWSYPPNAIDKNKIKTNSCFFVKKDMYEAIGSPDMRTQDGFLIALKNAKDKFPTVNGQPLITFGVSGFSNTGAYSLEDRIMNLLNIPFVKDGKLYDRYTDPLYISWLKVFRKANEMGLISKNIFVEKWQQTKERISRGEYFSALAVFDDGDFVKAQNDSYAKDPNSVYIAVDAIANPQKSPGWVESSSINGWMRTMITKKCKNPDRAIKFMSYYMSEEGQKDFYLGVKGLSWNVINGKEQFTPDALKAYYLGGTEFGQKYGAGTTYHMFYDPVVTTKWEPEALGPLKQMIDWTKGKCINTSLFNNIEPSGDSEEGIIRQKVRNEFGVLLPKLIMASSDEEFDKLLGEYNALKKKLDYQKYLDYATQVVNKNMKKLNMDKPTW